MKTSKHDTLWIVFNCLNTVDSVSGDSLITESLRVSATHLIDLGIRREDLLY